MDSNSSSSHLRKDPAWKYASLLNPDNKNDMKCNFCGKISKGGVYRAKQHLVGGFRNVTGCVKCPPVVRKEIKNFMLKKKAASSGRKERGISNFISKWKNAKQKGPIDLFFNPRAETVVQNRKEGKMRQTSTNEACKKELRERVCEDIAKWIYDSGVSFNCVKLPSFARMIESIGQYGPGMKPPSYHEIMMCLLKEGLVHTQDLMNIHEEDWAKYDCSIMEDGWTDSDEWLSGRMDEKEDEEHELDFEDEDFAWGVVSRAFGVGEALHRTRTTPILTSFDKRANKALKEKEKEPPSSSRPETKTSGRLGLIDKEECDSLEETGYDIGDYEESNGEDYLELDDEEDM